MLSRTIFVTQCCHAPTLHCLLSTWSCKLTYRTTLQTRCFTETKQKVILHAAAIHTQLPGKASAAHVRACSSGQCHVAPASGSSLTCPSPLHSTQSILAKTFACTQPKHPCPNTPPAVPLLLQLMLACQQDISKFKFESRPRARGCQVDPNSLLRLQYRNPIFAEYQMQLLPILQHTCES